MDRALVPQIRLSDHPESLDDLIETFISRYSPPASHAHLYFYHADRPLGGLREQRTAIYTSNNQFMIYAKWGDGTPGYLGCIATSRRTRAGEDHHRGSDLHDGHFTYETWFKILADIVSYELVQVAKSARQQNIIQSARAAASPQKEEEE